MKKLSIVLAVLCLGAALMLSGCGRASYRQDTLDYEINTYNPFGGSDVNGSFSVEISSGTVVEVSYDVVGLDRNGNCLWVEEKSWSSSGESPEDSPLTISFYISEKDTQTDEVSIENVAIVYEGSYAWLAIVGGIVAAGGIACLVVFCVCDVRKQRKKGREEP